MYYFRGDVRTVQHFGATWTLCMSSTVMTWRVLGQNGVYLLENNTLVLRRQVDIPLPYVVYLVATWRLRLRLNILSQSWRHRPRTQTAKTDCFIYPRKEITLTDNLNWSIFYLYYTEAMFFMRLSGGIHCIWFCCQQHLTYCTPLSAYW